MPAQGLKQYRIANIGYIFSADNNNIQSAQSLLMGTKALPDNPFDTIPCHGFPGYFPGYNQTQAWKTQIITPSKHPEMGISRSCMLFKNVPEFASASESRVLSEAGINH